MAQPKNGRNTMLGSLTQVRDLGFYPKTVIDVGVLQGTFALYQAFPNSMHFLIEPIKEHEPKLVKICSELKKAEYIIAAATNQSGTVNLNVSSNLGYSSIVNDSETKSSQFNLRTVQAITLDEISREKNLEGPYLIKVDVDGKEVDVLKGAVSILKETEYVIVEATLFHRMYSIMDFMKEQGFVAYDIVDFMYRPSDNALWQVDMAFVKDSGQFRKNRNYS